MPFLFKTQYGFSDKNGKGVYASEDIPAGSVYWTLMQHPKQVAVKDTQLQLNEIYTEEQFNALTDKGKIRDIMNNSYFFSKGKVLIGIFDGSYYFNHDPEGPSSTVFDGDLSKLHCIVTRDVKKGEQITQNYANWAVGECQWLEKVMKEHLPERYEFEMKVISSMSNEEKTNKSECKMRENLELKQQQEAIRQPQKLIL